MEESLKVPVRKTLWVNITFFAVTTLLGVVGTPLYIMHYGISLSEILVFSFFLVATPLCITAGYHRLFAHKSYKAHPFVQFWLLFFGAASFEQSAFKWASQHRIHHRYVDTDRDPYNIKKGFFYAHIGWLIFWKQPEDYSNVRDLEQNPMVMHQHEHYKIWAISAGIALPLLIGLFTGHMLGMFLIAVCFRITLVYHATFCINSFCHMFGKTPYDLYASAKDHWFAAVLTFGEGYHNYHHHFPVDYRNGVQWYHWDPTKWLIQSLAWVGLASELKKVSRYKIIAARLRTQHQRVLDALIHVKEDSKLEIFLRHTIKSHYDQLKIRLAEWELNHEYKPRFQEKLREWETVYSKALRMLTSQAFINTGGK